MIQKRLGLFLLLALGLQYSCKSVEAGKPAVDNKAKQYIYSRSNTPSASEALGLRGVPAYVSLPNGTRKYGTYVTQDEGSDSPALHMGLVPGTVLLTIDNVNTTNCTDIDNTIRTRPSGKYTITFVKMMNGLPQVITSSTSIVNLSKVATNSKGPRDNTPISSVESFLLSVINGDRARNGRLPALSDNQKLAALARKQAAYLLSLGGRLDHMDGQGHNPLDRAVAAGFHGTIGENLSMQVRGTRADKDLATNAEAEMMAEPATDPNNHRGHILSAEMKSVGVGIARDDRMLVIVEDFSDSP